jgi:transposase-like protein
MINAALAQAEALRALARRHGVARTTLLRHRAHAQRPHHQENPPMTGDTMPQSVTTVTSDDVELALGQLASQLAEAQTQLARTQAQLAGINREFAAWRTEQDAQRAQCAADHALAEQLRDCLAVLLHDDASWRLVESLLRGDGRNGKGPLLQALRRLVGRPERSFYGME